MTRLLALVLLAAAAPAVAQTPPADAWDRHRWQADQHRMEIDRLRSRADQRELQARQQALESRFTRMQIEARRQPEPYIPATPPALRSPEEARAAREAAAARRRAAAEDFGEIDAWLDRVPD
ncbi:MAG: hypothetical protein H2038_09525 [Brevundimonas sp.]|uniref:hypothetical protein n=1 Tax=Brevundimonas sp. TaxID=1871086 RepID=UPI001844FA4E|nr:hypothetical protein [Brevundimonas sp.]MBA4804876.1 hypothetical protein [Brevundimonas sp.]